MISDSLPRAEQSRSLRHTLGTSEPYMVGAQTPPYVFRAMSNDLGDQERVVIRKMCWSLRNLLNSVRPVSTHAFLHDIGDIESYALVANADEIPAVRDALHALLKQLRDAGIVTPERWKEFFGEYEP